MALLLFTSISQTAFADRDFGQCNRRCKEEYGASAIGKWQDQRTDFCLCKDEFETTLGKVKRTNTPNDIPSPKESVCGLDGKTYKSIAEAEQVGIGVMHAGACGQCSNDHDIKVYKDMDETLTGVTKGCALRFLLMGEKSAQNCLHKKVPFTEGCSNCWLNNMGCTLAHCKRECFISKITHEPNNINGQLNDCLACDERYCGGMFIRCAGANRRRAGIQSDIIRDHAEIWGAEASAK